MSDDTRTRGNSWRLLIGAPLTFVVFFVGSMVLDWRTLPLGTNLGGSLLDATYYTVVFAVLERLFSFSRSDGWR